MCKSLMDISENYAEIQRALAEELEDFPFDSIQSVAPNLNLSDPSVTTSIINTLQTEVRFDVTSVHDTSLRDAWSKVIQGVMEMLPSVEQLLVNFTGVRVHIKFFDSTSHSSADIWYGQLVPV